jgi:hypothetical protein
MKEGEERYEEGEGVSSTNVEDSWPIHMLFINITALRNYFGDVVGHEISVKIYLIYFFIIASVPYTLIFIL